VLVLLVGGIAWRVVTSQPGQPAWQPGSIENFALLAGPAATAAGDNYPQIATRAEDPAPLTTAELAKAFPAKYYGPVQVSADCAGAVTGQTVVRALRAAGCTQVLRLIATSTGTGGRYPGPIDIFNPTCGAAAYQAAREFGQESSTPDIGGPNVAPGGFILPWPGTAAAGVARAPGNAADVDSFGHFLAVLWTYGPNNGDDFTAGLVNGMFETILDQAAENRVSGHDAAG